MLLARWAAFVLIFSIAATASATPSFTGLGGIPGAPYVTTEAVALSGDGNVVAGIGWAGNEYVAYRWTRGGGMELLGDLPGGTTVTEPRALSYDGSVIAGYGNGVNGYEGVRWTQATGLTGLGTLSNGTSSLANGISGDGSVLVGYANAASVWKPVRWRTNHFYSEAYDISDEGRVVVGMGYAQNYEAFVWTEEGGIRSLEEMLTEDYGLDLAGWHLTRAVAVSDDGSTFSGTGVSPSGQTEAWIATIPEPASAALVTLGCVLLSAAKWRR